LARGPEDNCTSIEDVLSLNDSFSPLLSAELPGLPDGDYTLEILDQAAPKPVQILQAHLSGARLSPPLSFPHQGAYFIHVADDGNAPIANLNLLLVPEAQKTRYQRLLNDTRSKLTNSNILGSEAQVHVFLATLLREMGKTMQGSDQGRTAHED